MVVVGGARPDIVAPTGTSMSIPPVVTRIEDDGDGTDPRFYDGQGHLLRLPTRKDRQKMGASESVFALTDALAGSQAAAAAKGQSPSGPGPDWVEALMPSLEGKSARRAALQSALERRWEGQRAEPGICNRWKTKRRRYWQTTSGVCRSGDGHGSQRCVAIACDIRIRGRAKRGHSCVATRTWSMPSRTDPSGRMRGMVLDVELSNVTLSNVTLEDRR